MLTQISETETSKHFSSVSSSVSERSSSIRLISNRQKNVLYIIARQKSLTEDGLERHCNSLFRKGLDELDRVEASDFMKYFNRNILPAER